MNGKKISRRLFIIIAIGVITLSIVTGALSAYYQAKPNNNQNNNNQNNNQNPGTPKLESNNLQYNDNRTNPEAPFLELTGTVTNTGNAKALNCTIHLTASRNSDQTVIDTRIVFTEALDPGASVNINIKAPYTGEELQAYNAVLEWTN
ncbi:MAG: hypothetical protein NWE98_09660 [Candidatus Bathyarchaeota archaeon]|nr:hypothetical protein [Candidatus Bathyarchaeota archaeon]